LLGALESACAVEALRRSKSGKPDRWSERSSLVPSRAATRCGGRLALPRRTAAHAARRRQRGGRARRTGANEDVVADAGATSSVGGKLHASAPACRPRISSACASAEWRSLRWFERVRPVRTRLSAAAWTHPPTSGEAGGSWLAAGAAAEAAADAAGATKAFSGAKDVVRGACMVVLNNGQLNGEESLR